LHPYQRIVYAHILMLNGKYAEALDLCDRSVSESQLTRRGPGNELFGALWRAERKSDHFSPHWTIWKSVADYQRWQNSPDQNLSLLFGC